MDTKITLVESLEYEEYTSACGWKLARENFQLSKLHSMIKNCWVLRNANDEYVDHDSHRQDIESRQRNIKLVGAYVRTLRDFVPYEFNTEFNNTRAYEYLDIEIVAEYGAGTDVHRYWPGTHKNVYCWCILANGKAVGWNESPSRGWSFPVITAPKNVSTKIKVNEDTTRSSYTTDAMDDEYTSTSEDIHTMVTGISLSDEYFDLVVPFNVEKNKYYYLVIGTYSTGDSFNNTSGVVEYIGMYTSEASAKACAEILETHAKDYDDSDEFERSVVIVDDVGQEITFLPPWNGYFESLSSINIQAVSL